MHPMHYTELQPGDMVWMQHHITGKWDTAVQVTRKRKDGNSYIVTAEDGNTDIRGRRLLKPTSSSNTIQESTNLQDIESATKPDSAENNKCRNKDIPKAMPRRSPRNHVFT